MQHVGRVEADGRGEVGIGRVRPVGQNPVCDAPPLGVKLHARDDHAPAAKFDRLRFVELFGRDGLKVQPVRVIVHDDQGFPVHDQVAGKIALEPPEVRPPRRVGVFRPGFEGTACRPARVGVIGAGSRSDAGTDKGGGPVLHAVRQERVVVREVAGAGPREGRARPDLGVYLPEHAHAAAAPPARRSVKATDSGRGCSPKQFRQVGQTKGHISSSPRDLP